MARQGRSKNALIKCEYCGEMYSVTYKHCPFCNEDGTGRWDDLEGADVEEEYYDDAPRGGGKRLASRSRSSGSSNGWGGDGITPGRIIAAVLSLALIIAAAGIVLSIVRSVLGERGGNGDPDTSPSAPVTSSVPDPTPGVVNTDEPSGGDVTEPPADPTPVVNTVAPTDFKLNASDLTFDARGQIYDMRVIFTPSDATAPEVTWTSSDPNVASVAWNGRVTAVSNGTVNITATVEGLGSKSCIFRCKFKDSTSTPAANTSTPSTSTAPSDAGPTLSRSDFTLAFAGDKWRLVVSGTSSAVTWSSSDENVATVATDGTVTAVGSGTCRVTAEVDGVTLKCIVRCGF